MNQKQKDREPFPVLKYCTEPNIMENVVILVLLAIVTCLLVGSCFVEPFNGNLLGLVFWVPWVIGELCVFILFFRVCTLKLREYKITDTGMYIRDFMKKSAFYEWDTMKEIAICKVHYNHRAPYQYDIVIRCVVGNERIGPSEGFGAWQSILYEAVHKKDIVCIDFDEQIQHTIENKSGKCIVDYRHLAKNAFDLSS